MDNPYISTVDDSEDMSVTAKSLTAKSKFDSRLGGDGGYFREEKRNIFKRCIDSFKPPVNGSYDPENLKRSLKSRHLIMIAIGGSIGTGLFIGSGRALALGGPLALLIGWTLAGTQMVGTIHGLGEITVRFPVVGAFADYSTRFLDPSISFVVSVIYVLQWFFVLPLEIIASAMTMEFWDTGIDPVVWVAIFYTLIVSINLFGVKGFGEAEFAFSMVKVVTICMFIVLCLVLIFGGGPTHDYVGARYWHNPGALANGFKGVASVMVTASYSLGGSEMTCLASGETDPKEIPHAIKQIFWRIIFFFLVSLTLIGFLVPYNNENLLGGSSVNNSPFVIAISLHGIKGLPHLINAVILVSILSVGNSCIFASSRTLCSMAHQGLIPRIFGYVDRAGRPSVGILVNSLFGLLAFLIKSSSTEKVFVWLMAVAGLATSVVWLSINISHIRFRMAMKAQGKSLDELEFYSCVGIYGSIYSAFMNSLVLIAQFYISLFPIENIPSSARAEHFFQNYLCAIILLMIFLIHKVYYRIKSGKWWDMKDLREINLERGRLNIDIEIVKQEVAAKRKYISERPWYIRCYYAWC
ncbi:HCL266Wp [Eremothecium sinecaudum]|uniref:HCL266Wp n=1 Tax=Eremothecium sinecaudum TaxID=45286 RepID=A0A0X8HR32_9SACH|nr:HCL266Wp [Eremothecium sinecaudum]AMD19885.1 HCL266Wp [Eremothecium sinecaudum]